MEGSGGAHLCNLCSESHGAKIMLGFPSDLRFSKVTRAERKVGLHLQGAGWCWLPARLSQGGGLGAQALASLHPGEHLQSQPPLRA